MTETEKQIIQQKSFCKKSKIYNPNATVARFSGNYQEVLSKAKASHSSISATALMVHNSKWVASNVCATNLITRNKMAKQQKNTNEMEEELTIYHLH